MAYESNEKIKKGSAVTKPSGLGGATPMRYIGGLQSAVIQEKKTC